MYCILEVIYIVIVFPQSIYHISALTNHHFLKIHVWCNNNNNVYVAYLIHIFFPCFDISSHFLWLSDDIFIFCSISYFFVQKGVFCYMLQSISYGNIENTKVTYLESKLFYVNKNLLISNECYIWKKKSHLTISC